MTIDEAIHYLERIKQEYDCSYEEEALDIAIQALEQEPSVSENPNNCDAVSRQAVHEAITRWAGSMSVLIALPTSEVRPLLDSIHELPPVTPQEPKTVLYSGDGYADGYMVYDMAECPNCGYEYEDGDKDWGLSFCPNCGQKLNWESEDKE